MDEQVVLYLLSQHLPPREPFLATLPVLLPWLQPRDHPLLHLTVRPHPVGRLVLSLLVLLLVRPLEEETEDTPPTEDDDPSPDVLCPGPRSGTEEVPRPRRLRTTPDLGVSALRRVGGRAWRNCHFCSTGIVFFYY